MTIAHSNERGTATNCQAMNCPSAETDVFFCNDLFKLPDINVIASLRMNTVDVRTEI